jgi:hypothetical protein
MRLPHLLIGLVSLYIGGIVLAGLGGVASPGAAIANGSELNAPLVIVAAQLLGGFAALRARGVRARLGALLAFAACTLSLAAAAFDGDIGASGLAGPQVAYQLVIAAATAATWMVLLRRIAR